MLIRVMQSRESFHLFTFSGHRRRFKGGSPPPVQPVQLPPTPAPIAPPPPVPPPPTPDSANAQQAASDMRGQQMRKQGYNSTLLAGETGGYQGAGQQKRTLLG